METLYDVLKIVLAIALILGALIMLRDRKQAVKGWFAEYLWPILIFIAVIGVGLWWWLSTSSTPAPSGVKSSGWSSPSLATVRDWVWSSWLWILIVSTVLYVATSFIPKVGGTIKYIVAVGAVSLFTVIPLLAWVTAPNGSDQQRSAMATECVAGRPCALQQQTDGSTVPVRIPDRYGVCFSQVFHQHRDKLGYRTSFLGSPSSDGIGDTFWFTPEKGIPIPQYWLSKAGSSC